MENEVAIHDSNAEVRIVGFEDLGVWRPVGRSLIREKACHVTPSMRIVVVMGDPFCLKFLADAFLQYLHDQDQSSRFGFGGKYHPAVRNDVISCEHGLSA